MGVALSCAPHPRIATDALTKIKVLFESASGATITASIEYPAGTFTQLTFAGSASVTMGSGVEAFSDYATVSIPNGATFWIREFFNGTAGGYVNYNTWQNAFLGEATQLSTTALTDLTMLGTITNSGTPSGVSRPPRMIVGVTANKSVVIAGDSIAYGQADTEDTSASATGYNGVVGFLARSLDAKSIAFASYAIAGTTAHGQGYTLAYGKCSHLISEFSINDFQFSADTAATCLSDIDSFTQYAGPSVKVYQTTTTPYSNSSDGWTTLGVNRKRAPSLRRSAWRSIRRCAAA